MTDFYEIIEEIEGGERLELVFHSTKNRHDLLSVDTIIPPGSHFGYTADTEKTQKVRAVQMAAAELMDRLKDLINFTEQS